MRLLAYIFILCCAAVCMQDAHSQAPQAESTEKKPEVKVKIGWYKPKIIKKAKHPVLLLAGKTNPGATIEVASEQIPILEGGKVKVMAKLKDSVVSKHPTRANKKGIFAIKIKLPPGQAQIPIKISLNDEVSKIYQLQLLIEKTEVKRIAKHKPKKKRRKRKKRRRKKNELWLGTGFNYVSFGQDSDVIQSELNFDSFKFPSFLFIYENNLTKRWEASIYYKMSPGEADSTTEITLSEEAYNWQIIGLEGKYKRPTWRKKIFNKYFTQYDVRFGVLQHTVPFIKRTGGASSNAELTTNSLLAVAGGGGMTVRLNRNWELETFVKLQFPFSSGSEFDISPGLSFDGSVGGIYHFQKWKNWSLGSFWYGQWMNYDIDYTDDFTSADATGTQTLFYSNLEVRLGYNF